MMFNLFFYSATFVFGLASGSFLNSVIYRLEKNESFLKGRSYCPNCRHLLSWQDLIPLFSFFFLQGKCRYCRAKISLQYPLVELAAGILFVLVFYYTFPNFLLSTFYFLISGFLIVVFACDLKHYIIPDKIIYPAILITLIYDLQFLIFNQFSIFKSLILSAVLASSFFLAVVLLSQGRWMGVGDIKLAFLMGLLLGWPKILLALFLAFFSGAIIGVALMLAQKKTLKSEIPFGPFLITGTFVSLLWGEKITSWYFSLLI